MADYQDIRGLRVKYLSADPSNLAAGEVWYNSTTGTLRSLLVSEAWASGAPLILGRNLLGRAGTQTAALAISGYDLATNPPEVRTNVESYDGSGWSTAPVVNTARYGMQGDGTQTAAIIAGGISPALPVFKNATETYDGSSWTTSPNTINTTRGYLGHAGGPAASTASLIFGGKVPPGTASTTSSESWNGTSWTATPSLNDTGWGRYGCGTTTAALATGQEDSTPPTSGTTEEYNGASWTTVNPNAAGQGFRGVAGIQTAALAFGGANAPAITTTEYYDGTNWSAKPALAVARGDGGGTGTATSALCFGDTTPSPTSQATEEFNSSTSVITAGAWASGGSMTQPGSGKSATGTQTAGLAWGGYVGANTQTQVTEEYNGTSWTPGGSLPNQNAQGGIVGASGFGTQTAAVSAGGWSQGPVDYYYTTCWKYDGTSWTATGAISPGRARVGPGAGTESAGLTQGGVNPGNTPTNIYLTNTDHFDGSTWTGGGALPDGRAYAGICGIDTAALQMGGYNNPPSLSYSTSFDYNGVSWTAAGTMLAPGYGGSHMGGAAANASLVVGGPPAQNTNLSQSYNGTNWHTMPSVTTARTDGACGAGTQTAALAIGNAPAPGSLIVEEFTGETSAVNIETLTTS